MCEEVDIVGWDKVPTKETARTIHIVFLAGMVLGLVILEGD